MIQGEKKKDRWRNIISQLEEGVQKLFDSKEYKAYLNTMAKFTQYSLNNTLLIHQQCPDATFVAGYRSWEKNFNRHVKRGEHGITILAPCIYRGKEPKTKDEKSMREEINEPSTESEVIRLYFRPVTVFDVRQTEGAPIPQWGPEELSGNVEKYEEFLQVLEMTAPFPISFEKTQNGINGYCNYSQQRIVLRQGMGEEQTIKTAIHEIAHAEMHNQQKGRVESKKSRPVREVEAESVAYVVCRHYGLDTSEYSFPYIAGWEGRNPQILKESLNVIREAAENLVTEIDEKFLEIVKEKGYQKREIRTKQTCPERKTQVPGKIAPNERQVVL